MTYDRISHVSTCHANIYVGREGLGVRAHCDRCEFPVPPGTIECFWGCGLLPLQLVTGLSSSTKPVRCPPLPLRDPGIENAAFGLASAYRGNRSQPFVSHQAKMPQWGCDIHKGHQSNIMWHNMASHPVLFLGLYEWAIGWFEAWLLINPTMFPIVRERSTCWTRSFILFHCLWLSQASTFFHLSLQPLVLSASPCLCSGSPRSPWQNSINICWQAGMS